MSVDHESVAIVLRQCKITFGGVEQPALPDRAADLIESITALQAELAEVRSERDEATNWSDIVDRHGCDGFDDLADQWLSLPAIRRIHQAMSSPFAPYANEDIMQRFLTIMSDQLHIAYVEGCLAGVKAEAARTLAPQPPTTPERPHER